MPIVSSSPLKLTLLAAGVALSSCASSEPPAVVQASQVVAGAAASPTVQQYAPVELAQARTILAQARDAEDQEARHLAYLASQQARIAQNRAAARADMAEIEKLGDLRGEMLTDAARQRAAVAERRARQARAENVELREQLSDLKTRQTETGLVVTLSDVLFEFDQAQLQPGGRRQIARIAQALRDDSKSTVRIEGHTDSLGAAGYNRDLSQRRAEAVREAFIVEGIDPQRVQATGLGEAYPVATNDTAAGRQQNRRVDVLIQTAESN